MNEPHENLEPDPFAHDAARRPSRLRRTVVRRARLGSCVASAEVGPARSLARRQARSCPRADRNPLR